MATTSVYIVCDVTSPPIKLRPVTTATTTNAASEEASPRCLQAQLPASAFSDDQLVAFLRTHKEDNNNVDDDGGGAQDVYYEASLKMKFENGEDRFLGKLSKTTKCLHWEGSVVADATVKDVLRVKDEGWITIEADWQEYRIHVSLFTNESGVWGWAWECGFFF